MEDAPPTAGRRQAASERPDNSAIQYDDARFRREEARDYDRRVRAAAADEAEVQPYE